MDYIVVSNQEEQHSIWPASKAIPAGWQAVGGPASKEECLMLIERRWVDIRPKSLRTSLSCINRRG